MKKAKENRFTDGLHTSFRPPVFFELLAGFFNALLAYRLNFIRVMFVPAGIRIVLREFQLVLCNNSCR